MQRQRLTWLITSYAEKTEALQVLPRKHRRITTKDNDQFISGNKEISNIEISTHLGIKRSVTISSSVEENVDSNIQMARRSVYSFVPSGFLGHNGRDPPTCLHLIQIFVTPILTYVLEVVLPKNTQDDKLEVFKRKVLREVLSLPQTAADSAVCTLHLASNPCKPKYPRRHKHCLIMFVHNQRLLLKVQWQLNN